MNDSTTTFFFPFSLEIEKYKDRHGFRFRADMKVYTNKFHTILYSYTTLQVDNSFSHPENSRLIQNNILHISHHEHKHL